MVELVAVLLAALVVYAVARLISRHPLASHWSAARAGDRLPAVRQAVDPPAPEENPVARPGATAPGSAVALRAQVAPGADGEAAPRRPPPPPGRFATGASAARSRPAAGAGPGATPPTGGGRAGSAHTSGSTGPAAVGPGGDDTSGSDEPGGRSAPPPPAPGAGRAHLLAYGGRTPGGVRIAGPYAAIAVRTNGFAPVRDRVIEVAVVPLDASGRPDAQPYVTLLEPPGGAAGPTFLHGLEAADLRFAPAFGAIARQLLARLEGRVVVAHNAPFVEQFLAAEFLAAGMLVPTMPALDVTAAARQSITTPNYRLATLAAHLRLRMPRGGAALDEARLLAAILPTLLERLGPDLRYPLAAPPVLDVPRGTTPPSPRPRPATPDTVEPWLAELMTRVSASAAETNDPRVAAYLEALTDVVARGRIVTTEAGELASLLARSGYPASRIRTILERLLESLRIAAFEEKRIGPSQLRHLRAVAASVGIPTYFDDLIPPPQPAAPSPGSGTFSRPVRKPLPPAPPRRAPRCGHCLAVGHWTADCPRLGGRRSRGVGPVRPVDPI